MSKIYATGKNCDVIVGNLDVWVVDKRWEWMEPKNIYHEWMMNMAKDTRERLTEDQIQYLRMLPFTLSYMPEPGHEFFIFHGTPHEVGDTSALPLTLSDDEVKDYIKDVKADIMAHGHIHGPSIRQIGDQTIVCCAGVGMSWDGDPRPAYAVVEYLGDGKWHAETKRIEFDTEKAAQYNEQSWIEHSDAGRENGSNRIFLESGSYATLGGYISCRREPRLESLARAADPAIDSSPLQSYGGDRKLSSRCQESSSCLRL